MINEILQQFGFSDDVKAAAFGSGLINGTWLIKEHDKRYILQKVNTAVFKQPQKIDNNLRFIADYLQINHPGYLFTKPLPSISNETLIKADDGYYRTFEFVEGSHVYDVAERKEQAFEAAGQFGKFTCLLSGADISALEITLPDFHNLPLRYEQFLSGVSSASEERMGLAKEYVAGLNKYSIIVSEYGEIESNPAFKKRVTHHDTKISNVLFDGNGKGLCVIDLDTVMPGFFISDIGDMLRTYLSPADENETDLSKVVVREDYFEAIVSGYLSEMKDELTATEKGYFIYAGKFMIYMQALRFMADFLNNDIYYPVKYPLHNFDRALNQLELLNKFVAKENMLHEIVQRCTL